MKNFEFIKVKDHKDLIRAPVSNGIVNTNQTQYDEYIALRDAATK